MKNYLLLVLLSFLMSCKNDTKVDFNYEKKYGNVREIHTTFFNGENTDDGNILTRYVDSFNTEGNILKKETYIKGIDWDENNKVKFDENNKIIEKLQIINTIIYKYDQSLGLNRVDILDEKGKLVGVEEYTKIDKNTISVLRFGLDKKFEFRENIVVDEENLVSTMSYFDRDSVLTNKTDINRLDDKLINLLVNNDIKNKNKTNTKYKYLSFDKQGNYTKIKQNQNLVLRDVFYYPNK